MTTSTSLIDMILNMLRDPENLKDFQDDPNGWLASCGAGDATSQDIYEALVLLDDSQNADFGGDRTSGGNTINIVPPVHPPAPAPGQTEQEAAVNYLNTYITNNYTSIDDRDTDASTNINQQIDTGGGNFDQDFDIDTTVASGDGAVAAGDDIENSNIATGDRNVVGDNAQGVTGDDNTTGFGNGDVTSADLDDVTVGPGGAVSVGGNATGTYSDDDTTTDVDNYGDGDVNTQVTDDASAANQTSDQSETTTTTNTSDDDYTETNVNTSDDDYTETNVSTSDDDVTVASSTTTSDDDGIDVG